MRAINSTKPALFLLAAVAFTVSSGSTRGQTMPAQQLMDVDRAFNDMAQKEGVGKAFIAFAADDPTLIMPGNPPVLGRTDLVAVFSKVEGSALSWEPLKADIAQSQDLGYTFGRYKVRENGAIKTHGVYVSIWKKQPDGSWKYVVDGGGPTPHEVQIPTPTKP